MKGLLLKDFYTTVKYCRLQLGVIVVMTVISLFIDTGMAYLAYPILFAGMIPVYLLSADEKEGWDGYVQTLPVTRKSLVTEKYIVTAASVFAAAAFMMLLWLARLAVSGERVSGLGTILLLVVTVGLVYPAVILPMMFRFGVEKGRFIAAAGVTVIVAVFIVFEGAAGMADAAARLGAGLPAVALCAAALFCLSWLLAVKLYESREI